MQPKDRILDVYGSFAREIGGWLAIGVLIKLLATVEVDAQAVRSAASRMKRNGLLVSEKRDGLAGYALSSSATEILRDGSTRIFGPDTGPALRALSKPGQETDAKTDWVIVLFSVPEIERRKRYLIRSRLERLGFGQGPATSWFAPVEVLAETERMLARTGLSDYVTIWQGQHIGFTNLESLVASSWNLEMIRARYDQYLVTFEPLARAWGECEREDGEAFAAYIRQNSVWRELPYLDPGLPASVVPKDWPGQQARALFVEFERELRPAAKRYFDSIVG